MIKRSIDNGSNWTTQFTVVGTNCNAFPPYGSLLRCRTDGKCILPYINGAGGPCFIYSSTDDGVTWSPGPAGVACSLLNATSTAWDGTLGNIGSRSHIGTQQNWFTTDGSTWTITANWAGFNGSCVNSFIFNGAIHSICIPNALGVYTLRASAGALEKTLTLPGASLALSSGGLSLSIGTDIIYTLASFIPPSGNAPIGLWLSRDGGTTYNFIFQTPNNGMIGGDFYQANGCLYFSAGNSQMFAKICT